MHKKKMKSNKHKKDTKVVLKLKIEYCAEMKDVTNSYNNPGNINMNMKDF